MYSAALQTLDPAMRVIAQNELRTGEQALWAAQPLPRYFNAATIGAVLFAIPWTGFAIFWTTMAFVGTQSMPADDGVASGFKYFFPLFGIPIILIGLGMFTTPYWMARRLKRTLYVVSNQRAIVMSPGFRGSRKVRSFLPEALASMERTERPDGSGDLVFEQYTQRNGSSSSTVRNGFISVPRVRDVEELLRNTLLHGRVRQVEQQA